MTSLLLLGQVKLLIFQFAKVSCGTNRYIFTYKTQMFLKVNIPSVCFCYCRANTQKMKEKTLPFAIEIG